MTITLYSKERCPQCDATKRWLEQHDVTYVELPATEHVDTLTQLGYRQAPVIIVTTPVGTIDAHWTGYRPDRLKTLKKDVPA